jgi:hypothetical protein
LRRSCRSACWGKGRSDCMATMTREIGTALRAMRGFASIVEIVDAVVRRIGKLVLQDIFDFIVLLSNTN